MRFDRRSCPVDSSIGKVGVIQKIRPRPSWARRGVTGLRSFGLLVHTSQKLRKRMG